MELKKIYGDCDIFEAFPEYGDMLSSSKEEEHLLPIGVVDFKYFDKESNDKVLIAIPLNIPLDENALFIEYYLYDGKWKLDDGVEIEEDEVYKKEGLEEKKRFEMAKLFYKKNNFLQYPIEEEADLERKDELIDIGGNTPCGQNWDAYLEVEHEYRESEEFGEEEIIIFDNEGNQYTYIGQLTQYYYTDAGGSVIIFYEPKKKRVLLTFDMS